MYLELRGGVKSACSKGFDCLKRFILTWLNGRTVDQLNSSIFVKFFNISTIKLKNLFTTLYSQFTKKLFAFTLAETLIVMGVIGVVAALTLPNLNSSTNNKEKIVKLKKVYQNINEAFDRATAVYGPANTWGGIDTNALQRRHCDRLIEFLKVSYTEFNSGSISSCKFTLADGTDVMSGFVARESGWQSVVIIDIDGNSKGKNALCTDKFRFEYNQEDGYQPYGRNDAKVASGKKYNAAYCALWVLENENMDYVNCASDLVWGEKITCK